MKVTKRDQQIASDILTQFMFTRNMEDVLKVWDQVYKQYDLCSDPFTGTPCNIEEYCRNQLEYERQSMIERFGHCDGLD